METTMSKGLSRGSGFKSVWDFRLEGLYGLPWVLLLLWGPRSRAWNLESMGSLKIA